MTGLWTSSSLCGATVTLLLVWLKRHDSPLISPGFKRERNVLPACSPPPPPAPTQTKSQRPASSAKGRRETAVVSGFTPLSLPQAYPSSRLQNQSEACTALPAAYLPLSPNPRNLTWHACTQQLNINLQVLGVGMHRPRHESVKLATSTCFHFLELQAPAPPVKQQHG